MKPATEKLLAKAERAVSTAQVLFDLPDVEAAVARTYYAMFYTAEALLAEEEMRFRKHGGVHAAIGRCFVMTGKLDPKYHRWLLTAFEKRVIADYGIEESIAQTQAREMLGQAREFLVVVRRLLEARD